MPAAPAPPTIETAPSAYGYPLLIKQLLVSPLIHSADQEIVYRDHQALHVSHVPRIGSDSWRMCWRRWACSRATRSG